MRGGAGLRRTTYGGDDPEADKAFRGVSDQLSYFQKLPTTQGVLFQKQDFGTQTSSKVFQLKHTLGRKAQGISVMSCAPKSAATPMVPPGYPVHMPTLDDERVANIFMTADLATHFIWALWVW